MSESEKIREAAEWLIDAIEQGRDLWDTNTVTVAHAALAYADVLDTGKKVVSVREGWEPCSVDHPFPVDSPSLCVGCDGTGWRIRYTPKGADDE